MYLLTEFYKGRRRAIVFYPNLTHELKYKSVKKYARTKTPKVINGQKKIGTKNLIQGVNFKTPVRPFL